MKTIRSTSLILILSLTCPPFHLANADDQTSWANTYAEKAEKQVNDNARLQCGFSGDRWNPNPEDHRQWALENNQETADSEVDARDQALKECLENMSDQDYAERYATYSVQQVEKSIEQECAYSGPRWVENHDEHYNWALTAPRAEAENEIKLREEELKSCSEKFL